MGVATGDKSVDRPDSFRASTGARRRRKKFYPNFVFSPSSPLSPLLSRAHAVSSFLHERHKSGAKFVKLSLLITHARYRLAIGISAGTMTGERLREYFRHASSLALWAFLRVKGSFDFTSTFWPASIVATPSFAKKATGRKRSCTYRERVRRGAYVFPLQKM